MDVQNMVLVIDCSKPMTDKAHARYRPMTKAEQKQRAKDVKAALADSQRRAWLALRAQRDRMLSGTDHVEDSSAWEAWRHLLRDLPSKTTDPENPKWPAPPWALSTLIEFRDLWPELDWARLETGA